MRAPRPAPDSHILHEAGDAPAEFAPRADATLAPPARAPKLARGTRRALTGRMRARQLWRIIVLTVLGYEGLGALVGGILLVTRPDGSLMKMPVEIMHGTFTDFLIPGTILTALGALNLVAFVAVWRRRSYDWIASGLALGGMAIWFFVEILILRELHWLHAMWGLPVIAGLIAAAPLLPFRSSTLRDAWLTCGVLSSLLYVAMNVIVPSRWPGYDSASQVVSELSAVAAPTRPLWVALAMFYTLLVIAFGWGVWMAGRATSGPGREARGDHLLRAAGVLIAVYGALGLVWPFAPMHLREALAAGAGDFSDTMHIALGVATELIYLAALVLAAIALGGAFRAYSIATVLALIIFGALTFRDAPSLGSGGPTPLIGVWERINIGVFLLWVIVLAIVLLRRAHLRQLNLPRASAPPGTHPTRLRPSTV